MIKKMQVRWWYVLSCCIFFLVNIHKAKASHAMGADLSYECVDPVLQKYKITLNFYHDCSSGIDSVAQIPLNYTSVSCGGGGTAFLTQEPCPPAVNGGVFCEVSPLCKDSISRSTCNGGNLPGVKAYRYSAFVTFPAACTDWTLSININYRNNSITNLDANGSNLYVEATLNNTIAGGNNSPVFSTLPVPYICRNQSFFYNHGAVDANGDSLVYSLINPLDSGAVPIPYTAGFSPAYPMNTASGTFPFNTGTGQMSFTPSGVQVAVITVLVKEYRKGVLIGSTMRDIQIVTLNLPGCSNPSPTFTGMNPATVQNGLFINSSLVEVCPGNALSFSTLAVEQTGAPVYLQSNIAQAIPGAQFTITSVSPDSAFGMFQWTPTGLDTGDHTFIAILKNDNCPLTSNQAYAVTIRVLRGMYAGPDLAYCPAGGAVQLQVYGGTSFTWSPTSGLNNPFAPNPLASPAQTTTYIITGNTNSRCKNTDTVTVFRVPDFSYSLSKPNDTICRFDRVQLNVIPDSTYSFYSYFWTPGQSLSSATIPNPIARPDSSTTYFVTIISDTGCTIKDSIRVPVSGQGPFVNIDADKTVACHGDTIQLTADIYAVPCGLSVFPCKGEYVLKTVGTGVSSARSPYNQLYEDSRMQLLFRASELQAAGMAAGTITAIAFDIFPVISSIHPYYDFTIKMGCTALSELSGFQPGLQTVMADPSFLPAGTGFNTHNFDTPYDWDGVSNLVIEICYDNPNMVSSLTDFVRSTNLGYNCVALSQGDNTSGCNLNAPSSEVFTYTVRPNIRLVYCQAPVKTITYAWTAGTNLFNTDSLNPFAVMVENSTYYLTANDSFCTGIGSLALTLQQFNYTLSPDAEICKGNSVQLSGTGPYSYVWQPAAGLSCANCPNPMAAPAANTTYYAAITDTAYGCLTADSVSIDVQALSVAFPADTIRIDRGEFTVLDPQIAGGNGTFTYNWSPPDYLDNDAASSPVSTPLEDISYTLTVRSGLCTAADSVLVLLNTPEIKVIMPNAFSPNADGTNDTFFPLFTNSTGVTVKSFRIYNRSGERVHNSPTPWDGSLRGALQPAGTFVYYLEVELADNKMVKRQGEVTVLH